MIGVGKKMIRIPFFGNGYNERLWIGRLQELY